MAPLGALSQSLGHRRGVAALGRQISGLWRFDDLWIALSEGPAFDDYVSGSGQSAGHGLVPAGGPAARATRASDGLELTDSADD